jgi:hypothetical protein
VDRVTSSSRGYFNAEMVQLALDAEMERPTDTLVLIAFARRAPRRGPCIAWPSLATIENEVKLDAKTVTAAIARLEGASAHNEAATGRGFLFDTGDRKGATRRVRVMRIAIPPESGGIGPSPIPPNPVGFSEGETPPFFPSNTPENAGFNTP